MLKERSTYEIMAAGSVGFDDTNSIVLGKHSGRHALQSALMELGYEVSGHTLNQAFKRFKELADKKKQVTAMDLEALVTDELRADEAAYTLEWFDVEASTRRPPHATVSILTPDGRERPRRLHRRRPNRRDLPRDQRRHPREARLREFRIDAVTGGQDALGEASVDPRALGLERRRPGRLDRHHRGRRAGLRARALERRAQGRLAAEEAAEPPQLPGAVSRRPCA